MSRTICLLVLQSGGAQPEDDRIKNGLVGTWESVSLKLPLQCSFVRGMDSPRRPYLARFQTWVYGLPMPVCVSVSPSTLSLNFKDWPIKLAVLSLA